MHGAETIQQLLNAGLLDEIHVDIAAVLLGSGVRLFGHLAATPAVLGNPTVIPGVGVTHLRYPGRRTYQPHTFLARRCRDSAPRALLFPFCPMANPANTDSGYGKFGWVMDPEGNKVELWQPSQGQ